MYGLYLQDCKYCLHGVLKMEKIQTVAHHLLPCCNKETDKETQLRISLTVFYILAEVHHAGRNLKRNTYASARRFISCFWVNFGNICTLETSIICPFCHWSYRNRIFPMIPQSNPKMCFTYGCQTYRESAEWKRATTCHRRHHELEGLHRKGLASFHCGC